MYKLTNNYKEFHTPSEGCSLVRNVGKRETDNKSTVIVVKFTRDNVQQNSISQCLPILSLKVYSYNYPPSSPQLHTEALFFFS
jgi:hypothetical protein